MGNPEEKKSFEIDYSEVREKYFHLIHKVRARGILCQHPDRKTKHRPSSIGDFVLADEPKERALIGRLELLLLEILLQLLGLLPLELQRYPAAVLHSRLRRPRGERRLRLLGRRGDRGRRRGGGGGRGGGDGPEGRGDGAPQGALGLGAADGGGDADDAGPRGGGGGESEEGGGGGGRDFEARGGGGNAHDDGKDVFKRSNVCMYKSERLRVRE